VPAADAGDTADAEDGSDDDASGEDAAADDGDVDPPCGIDSDGDTIVDANEGSGDADGDRVPNRDDGDSDGDTIPDAIEAGDAEPCTAPVDSDEDTVPDFLDTDGDDDTIGDLHEGPGDLDGDTVPNRSDSDSDGDGIPDRDEAGDDDPATPPIDTDGDTLPDFLDADSAPCPARPCEGPGAVCRGGVCTADCRDPAAADCAVGTRCDWTGGLCVAPDAACVLFGEPDPCPDPGGGAEWGCGPGSACTPEGGCTAVAPCGRLACSADRVCRGEICACERPVGSCAPATTDQLSGIGFARSAMDLEFDDACHAYTVTMISGTDYLREMLPDGTLNVWAGVANLNMGEAAVLRRQGGEFGGSVGEVALTYICCATCGCAATPPQGVAHLARASGTLPHVIEATTTTGTGPFGAYHLDTGPYGLTWGRDRNLYVGNVSSNGQVHRIDLETAATSLLATLPSRVHAQAPFDLVRLLVATQDRAVRLLHTRTGGVTAWATVDADVTSIARDPFTGRVYLELRDARILEFEADGTFRGPFATAPHAGRITIAPDGGLYHIDVLGVDSSGARVTRWDLPATR
jgi:hypothetical protein